MTLVGVSVGWRGHCSHWGEDDEDLGWVLLEERSSVVETRKRSLDHERKRSGSYSKGSETID